MDQLNKWLMLLANVGVVVGIGVLVYEIRQNTEAMYSQTRGTIYAGAQEELWKNIEYPDVTLNFRRTEHVMTPEEKVRLDAWLAASMRAREYAWMEYDSGNIDHEYWQAEQQVIQIVLGTDRTRTWWKDIARPAFYPEFANEVDKLIDGPEFDYAGLVLSLE